MHQHLPKPKRKIWPAVIALFIIGVLSINILQTDSENFQVQQVKEISTTSEDQNNFFKVKTQEITFQNDQQTQYSISGDETSIQDQSIQPGEKIITYKDPSLNQVNIVDKLRLTPLILLLFSFIAITIIFTGKETIYSFLSLTLTIITLLLIIKAIISGTSPLLATIVGCLTIGTISIYIAHGFNQKTHLSTISIVSTLLLTLLSSVLVNHFAKMTGTGSESSFYLANANLLIDLKSLLLAGILVGTLGVLDDITTSQIATIHEIHHANNKLNFKQLYQKGLNVGKTHISSLINTLVLAYAGGSLPLLLLLFTDPSIPFWVTINQEFFAEEIIRTLIGSISLVLAVPISTALAAKYYTSHKHIHETTSS
jgi:uncharacterized membrane protein